MLTIFSGLCKFLSLLFLDAVMTCKLKAGAFECERVWITSSLEREREEERENKRKKERERTKERRRERGEREEGERGRGRGRGRAFSILFTFPSFQFKVFFSFTSVFGRTVMTWQHSSLPLLSLAVFLILSLFLQLTLTLTLSLFPSPSSLLP